MLLKTTFEMNQALPDTPSQGGAFGAFGAFEEEEERWIRVFVAQCAFFHSDFNATFCYVCKMASTEAFFFFLLPLLFLQAGNHALANRCLRSRVLLRRITQIQLHHSAVQPEIASVHPPHLLSYPIGCSPASV